MTASTYEQLIAFAAGELSGEQAAAVAAHVQRDPAAAALVHAWQSMHETVRRDDGVEPTAAAIHRARAIFAQRAAMPSTTSRAAAWIESAQRLVARLVYDSRVQPAAVRFAGEDDRINLTFQTETGEIDLQAERLPEGKSAEQRWRVVGQIGVLTAGSREVALALRDSKIPVMVAAADEHGGFAFEISSGAYDLLVQAGMEAAGDERVIVLSPLELP